jgi:hypothetical protein
MDQKPVLNRGRMAGIKRINADLVSAKISILVLVLAFGTGLEAQKLPDLIPYRKGELWGYADSTRKVVIEPRWKRASIFQNNRASVEDSLGFYAIDQSGRKVTRYFMQLGEFNHGCAKFLGMRDSLLGPNMERNIITGFIDTSGKELWANNQLWMEGNMLSEYKDGYSIGGDFYGDKWIFDRNGNKVKKIKYAFWTNCQLTDELLEVIKCEKKDFYSGVMNKEGELVIPCDFDEVGIKDSVILASKDSVWRVFNLSGKLIKVLRNNFDEIFDYNNGILVALMGGNIFIMDLNETTIYKEFVGSDRLFEMQSKVHIAGGRINVLSGGQWKYYNLRNKKMEGGFDFASAFDHGMAYVEMNGLSYVIDSNLQIISACRVPVKSFGLIGHGLAVISTGWDQIIGYIDKYGTEYWEDQ